MPNMTYLTKLSFEMKSSTRGAYWVHDAKRIDRFAKFEEIIADRCACRHLSSAVNTTILLFLQAAWLNYMTCSSCAQDQGKKKVKEKWSHFLQALL